MRPRVFRRLVFDSVDSRMVAIRDLFESGVSEMTGKTKRIVGDRPEEQGEIVGRFGGVKATVPALAHFSESPKRIAAAIRKGRRDRLYGKIREAVLEEVLIDEGEHIQSFIDSQRPAQLAALMEKPAHERRETFKSHAGRSNCKKCKGPHTFSIHLSHGRGAYERTHGQRPQWVKDMLISGGAGDRDFLI